MHSYRQDQADVLVRNAPVSDGPSHLLVVSDIAGLQTTLDAKTTTNTLKYRALISQAGTAAPTTVVLESTLSGAIVWTRASMGIYVGTLAGAFTVNKTFTSISSVTIPGFGTFIRVDANSVSIATYNAGASDDLLSPACIEILVYT